MKNFSSLDYLHTLEKEYRRILKSNVYDEFIRRLRLAYKRKIEKKSVFTSAQNLQILTRNDIIDYEKETLQSKQKNIHAIVKKIALIKLNGGIATTMDLLQAKSTLTVKKNNTFLDLIARQLQYYHRQYNTKIPILFLNSENTHQAFQKTSNDPQNQEQVFIQKIKSHIENKISTLSIPQNIFPRLLEDSLRPLETRTTANYYPPGHGEIYSLLLQPNPKNSLLEELIASGYEYVLISNADNINATIDPNIALFVQQYSQDFLCEVVEKIPTDNKGGFFAKSSNHSLELIEYSQIIEQKNLRRLANENIFFNTNNIWIKLKALQKLAKKDSHIALNVIFNTKKVAGQSVLQLETSAASIISHFKNSQLILVPRRRFTPVKTFEDLLIKRSNCYQLDNQKGVLENFHQEGRQPKLQLSKHYLNLNTFEQSFAVIPGLRYCTSLKIDGPFIFDHYVELYGNIELTNSNKQAKFISEIAGKELHNATLMYY